MKEIKNSGAFLYIVILFYLVTCFFSSGYHHFDEHYQILEFATYKLGLTDPYNLAWEFTARIRPSLQPTIAFLVIKALIYIGVKSPHLWAFSLRLLTAISAIFVIKKFIDSFLPEINRKVAPYYIIFSYLLWFLPYVNVRFSGETWSGLSFLIAIVLVRHTKFSWLWVQFLLVGIAFGFSILFKYQAGILVLGSIVWQIFIKRIRLQDFVVIILSIVLILFLGFLLDCWFYNDLVITIQNYYQVNISQNIASIFGVSPWYQYIVYILIAPIFPVGCLILISLIILIYRDPRNQILWAIIPFVIIHSIIPHKELRFLFQIINFAPLIICLGYGKINIDNTFNSNFIVKVCLYVLLVLNFFALICASLKSAGDGRLSIAEYINSNFAHRKVNLLFTPGSNPYDNLSIATDTFYKDPNVEVLPIQSLRFDNVSVPKQSGALNLLVLSQRDLKTVDEIKMLTKYRLRKIKESIPWISSIGMELYEKSLYERKLTLYEFF